MVELAWLKHKRAIAHARADIRTVPAPYPIAHGTTLRKSRQRKTRLESFPPKLHAPYKPVAGLRTTR